jgi:hypothetical protein
VLVLSSILLGSSSVEGLQLVVSTRIIL